ncbi:hypothetical protein KUV85_08380 [Nocardioides panacisoli]|uniref:DUF2231 domain-containing protein n=1 Tax=Nocardioides panacisoli TaxID=627624 RepID=UPI001C635B88|nr:DUF2231 domain-containing protein [Nocardioides panacisoli]QYJ05682.1 hypothetical protein KUV85_08380 [Nocardioides panacisoli]
MEINGLPLHPLAVHGAVVLAPIASLVALAYLVPALRDRLRWPTLVLALVAAAAVLVAYFSGDSFREANDFFNDPGAPVTEKIDTHEDRGALLMWWSLAFAAIAVITTALHRRDGWVRWLLAALLAVDAVAVLVLVVLTGDSGARAVWDGFAG